MSSSAVAGRPMQSPRWLWALAILLGPAVLAFFVWQVLTINPWYDVFVCRDALQIDWVGIRTLFGMACLPTVALVGVAILLRAPWFKPAMMTLVCGVCSIALALLTIVLTAPPPFVYENGYVCSVM